MQQADPTTSQPMPRNESAALRNQQEKSRNLRNSLTVLINNEKKATDSNKSKKIINIKDY